MNYSEKDYDELAKTATLEEIQTLYYEKKIILVCDMFDCLFNSLLKINRMDEVMQWIFDVDSNKSFVVSSKKGNLEVVKYLIKKGADLHTNNEDALRYASSQGHLEVVKYLIEKGADIHVINNAPLRIASSFGKLNVVKYLIEKGADVHACNLYTLKEILDLGHKNVLKYLHSLDPEYYDKNYPDIVEKLKAN